MLKKDEEKPKKTNWKTWFFIIVGIGLIIMWALTFTNLSGVFGITDIPLFQNTIRNYTYRFTFIYVFAFVLLYWLKDKYGEWSEKEGLATHIIESHKVIPKIKEYAYKYHGIRLGQCIKIQGLMIHKEAGAAPVTRFFLFENIKNGEIYDYSCWVVHYFKFLNIHLFKSSYFGRDNFKKYWTGEYRNEQHQGILDMTATKKSKDTESFKRENEEKSITEEY